MMQSIQTTQTLTQAADNAVKTDSQAITLIVLLVIIVLVGAMCAIYVIARNRHEKNGDAALNSDSDSAADNVLTRRSTVSVILVACSGYMNTRMFTFRRELIIGRDSSVCTVVYPQKIEGISGTHCKLYVESGGVFLADLNSANGTYLENGESVLPHFPVRLSAGEKFYVGNPDNMFEVRL